MVKAQLQVLEPISISFNLFQLCLCSSNPPRGGIIQSVAVWFISMESTNCNHINLILLLGLVLPHAKVASMLASMMSFSQSSENMWQCYNLLACSPQMLQSDLLLPPEDQAQSSMVPLHFKASFKLFSQIKNHTKPVCDGWNDV